jgi:hypothetical protein
MNRFIEHSQDVTANKYAAIKVTVTIAHKIKSPTSACLVVAW